MDIRPPRLREQYQWIPSGQSGIGVVGGRAGGFSFGVFPLTGIDVVGGVDGSFSFGASSWTGIDTDGSDGGVWFGASSWTGIGVVGGGDGRFLFGGSCRAIGRAPNFWKYELQVVDSSVR